MNKTMIKSLKIIKKIKMIEIKIQHYQGLDWFDYFL